MWNVVVNCFINNLEGGRVVAPEKSFPSGLRKDAAADNIQRLAAGAGGNRGLRNRGRALVRRQEPDPLAPDGPQHLTGTAVDNSYKYQSNVGLSQKFIVLSNCQKGSDRKVTDKLQKLKV